MLLVSTNKNQTGVLLTLFVERMVERRKTK